ncbi:MAG: phosphoribosylglycinamide formyltransferase [Ornithinimicrobium sp.]
MPHTHRQRTPVVVLVSGSGTLLQALIDAEEDTDYGVEIAAVGADRDDIEGLHRAERAGLPTFVSKVTDYPDRAAWDAALAHELGRWLSPHPERPQRWVITAGFMKVLGPQVLDAFTVLNSHPALLPSFPGAHAVHDALARGARITGATVHFVDEGVDTGPIVAQRAVPVRSDDTKDVLHERIKVVERDLLVRTVHRVLNPGSSPSPRKVHPA